MNVIIYDVVREVSVLMVMVFCVVNGNLNVKLLIRKKVLEIIERLGYCLNVVVCGLVSKKIMIVGVIIFDILNIFYVELVCGIEDIVIMYKYNIILSNFD